jgi:uncharacterized protein YbjT (DUF2867 family)
MKTPLALALSVGLALWTVVREAPTEGQDAPPATPPAEPATVLVAGATGSIGKFVVRDLLAAGHRVRGIPRRLDYAREGEPRAEWFEGDLCDPDSLGDAVDGADAIVFVAGSKSWEDPTNTPELVDYGGVAALADLGALFGVERMVLVSSAGVTQSLEGRSEHLRNVLKWKRLGEEHLRSSGLDYTILRPLGMWDRPARELGIAMTQGDRLASRVTISREDLARVVVHCVFSPDAAHKTFEPFNAAAFDVDGWKQDLAQLSADAPEPAAGR